MNKELQDYYLKVSGIFYDVDITAVLDCPKKALENCPDEFKPLAEKVITGELPGSFAVYIATRKKEWEMANIAELAEKLRHPLEDYLYDEELELFDKIVQIASGEHSV